MAREVRIWKGSVTAELARYQPAGILVDRLSAENGGVDVMDDGTVFVSGNDEGMVMASDPQHRMTGQIGGGSVPSLSGPRGVAFLPDGRTLWVMSRYGQVQRWEKTNAP
jgi:DNA-binding beta-propeller fold protein YncE